MNHISLLHSLVLALVLGGVPAAALADGSAQTKQGESHATTASNAHKSADSKAITGKKGESGQTDEALKIADKVQAAYNQVRDFSAHFTQTYHSVSMNSERTSKGRVFFKKPGKMRWDYSKPQPRYLISDGKTLWIYEPQFAQYYSQPLADSELPSALRFLMGKGDLRADFAIRIRERKNETVTLELVPKKRNSQYARLFFEVSPASGDVHAVTVVDALGNRNRLAFHDVKKNQGLPDSGFRFAPPKGTTRVKAPSN